MTRRTFAPTSSSSSNLLPMTAEDLDSNGKENSPNGSGIASQDGSINNPSSLGSGLTSGGGGGFAPGTTRSPAGAYSNNSSSAPSSSRFGFGLGGNSSSNSHNGHYYGNHHYHGGSGSSSFRIPVVIRRIFRPPTLDFETAIWEIIYLVISPTKVYKSLYYHKQTKNKWARDDPSFMILLSSFLIISALGWGLAYSPGVLSVLKLMVYMVLVDFFATGVVVATIGWVLANRFLRIDSGGSSFTGRIRRSWFGNGSLADKLTGSSSDTQGGGNRSSRSTMIGGDSGDLEWAYCFDVHCNSFLIIWLCLYVIQFLMLPLLTRNNWFCLFLGNSLYLFAVCYYFIITFYGYNALPFLQHTELLLAPIPILIILYIFSLFGFNVVKTMGSVYFGI